MILSQKNLCCRISTVAGENAFVVQKFTGEEELSRPFRYRVDLLSAGADRDPAALAGTEATLTLFTLEESDKSFTPARSFSGVITEVTQGHTVVAEEGAVMTVYHITLRPSLWLLKLSRDYRIFQNRSAQEIITTLCEENGVKDVEMKAVTAGRKQRVYCVQYGESHYDFILRLMEEEGLFYYFRHDGGKHTLVIIDGNRDFVPLAPAEVPMSFAAVGSSPYLNQIGNLSHRCRTVAKAARVNDFDYEKPSVLLRAASQGDGKGGEVYYYPGLYTTPSEGEALADERLLALEWQRQTVSGKSTVLSMCAGYTFTVTGHPAARMNRKYVTARLKFTVEQTVENGAVFYANDFEGFPVLTPYKPLPTVPKPRVAGSQTAVVTGPAGQEVYADAMGRIKVHFPWDVRGKKNEDSSCWIRVAQSWSGNGWGALVIPRIGMEVVVAFVDGDPDRPLVTGCVYNGEASPPYSPEDNPEYSTMKSRTLKGAGCNEFRFSDLKDHEEIYTFAQRDMNTLITRSRSEEIREEDDTLVLDKGSKHQTLKGSGTTYDVTVEDGDYRLLINKGNASAVLKQGDHSTELDQGNMFITLKQGDWTQKLNRGNAVLNVTGDLTVTTTGRVTIRADQDISLQSMTNIALQAQADITAQAGGNFSVLAGATVQAQAAMVDIKAAGTMQFQAQGIAVFKSSGLVMIKGSMTMIG